MAEKFRIGLLSSAWDRAAWELVKEVHHNVESGVIPNSEVAFVFCSREEGETGYGDLMIRNCRELDLPLIAFSSLRFERELRMAGREAEKRGDSSVTDRWRLAHDEAILNLMPQTDLDVLLGYMWVVGKEMCRERTIINLHPALPGGPKGTYREVIWQLIESGADRTGLMMHLVTEELDMGPPIIYCSFPIRGEYFNASWLEIEEKLKTRPLEQIIKEEGENNSLFRLIRGKGVKREFSVIIWAIKMLVEGRIRIEGNEVIDSQGRVLERGYDVTEEINET